MSKKTNKTEIKIQVLRVGRIDFETGNESLNGSELRLILNRLKNLETSAPVVSIVPFYHNVTAIDNWETVLGSSLVVFQGLTSNTTITSTFDTSKQISIGNDSPYLLSFLTSATTLTLIPYEYTTMSFFNGLWLMGF